MRLTERERDADILQRLFEISSKSFDLIERPPIGIFENNFKTGEVFVDDELSPTAYAILINRGGPWLWSIAVTSGLRNLGIGGKLMDEVIEFAKVAGDHIGLTVRADNVAAQVLYLKKGFQPEKVIPRYYTSGIDGVVMVKKF